MRVRLIDTYCTGVVHERFNASLLAMLTLLFDQISYYSSKSSKERVFSIAKDYDLGKVTYSSIYVVEGRSKIVLLMRYIVSALSNLVFLLLSKKNELLIFNYNNPFSLSLLNLLFGWRCW